MQFVLCVWNASRCPHIERPAIFAWSLDFLLDWKVCVLCLLFLASMLWSLARGFHKSKASWKTWGLIFGGRCHPFWSPASFCLLWNHCDVTKPRPAYNPEPVHYQESSLSLASVTPCIWLTHYRITWSYTDLLCVPQQLMENRFSFLL